MHPVTSYVDSPKKNSFQRMSKLLSDRMLLHIDAGIPGRWARCTDRR